MNPQLYFDLYRSPVEFQLAGYQKGLPSATVIQTDTEGELFLRVILQRDLGESSAEPVRLAQQWAGDRMAILQQGNSTTVLWMLVFNDPSSAARFATILCAVNGPAARRCDGPSSRKSRQCGTLRDWRWAPAAPRTAVRGLEADDHNAPGAQPQAH